jgi:UDPglucose 6-dehydrogenase
VRHLLAEGALVAAFDPAVGDQAPAALASGEVIIPEPEVVMVGDGATLTSERRGAGLPGVALDRFFVTPDAYEACRGASVLAVLTEWDEFRWLDFERIARLMSNPAVVDARNILDPAALRRCGFSYQGIGR